MEVFECTYFDGKSSVSFPASVFLKEEEIVIQYRNEQGENISLNWDVNNIVKNEFTGRHTSVLKYGEFPFQTIEVSDPAFAGLLSEKYPKAPFNRLAQNFYGKFSFGKILALGFIFVLFVAGVYFYLLPVAADVFAKNLSYGAEQSLGYQLNEKFISEFEPNVERTRLINSFFREMDFKPQHQVNITVIKSKEINAFAIPGGYIYVFDSIINILDNENQLAALLAHEYSHIELRHSTRAIIRNLAGYMFMSILLGDVSGATAIILQNAESLKALQYTRGLEEEADRHAVKLMMHSKLNPSGMPGLLEKLKKHSDDAPFEIISSHPSLKKRIQYLQNEIYKSNFEIKENDALKKIWIELKKEK